MPLKPGNSKETVNSNISEFHTGPTYAHTASKLGKQKANAQAIAVALNTARKYAKKAEGGAAFGTGSPAEEMDKPNPLADYLRKIATNAASLPQRAIEAAGRYQPGSGEIPNETIATGLEAAMLPMGTGAVAGVPVRAGEAVLGAGPIRAYHGSPHDFDKFDLSKIGTGEGAQSYGHGLYFAEHEGVARAYRDALARKNQRAATVPGGPFGNVPILEQDPTRPGRMYEVNINADPAHFLDWDKPLGQQPRLVRDAMAAWVDKERQLLKDAYPKGSAMRADDANFASQLQRGDLPVNQMLWRQRDQANASAQLSGAGIPGIKYLDQGSRIGGDAARIIDKYGSREKALEAAQERLKSAGMGDLRYWDGIVKQLEAPQSSNYVVFNDQLIDILRKYGIAIPGAAGAAGASIQGNGAEKMKRGGVVLDRALRVAKKYASGGVLDETGLGEVENHVPHIAGALRSDIPGRTDKLPISVKAGSYVVPSDTISALGEGNTDAGSKIMGHMLHQHRMRMAAPPATPGSIRVPGRLKVPGPKKIRMRSAKTIPMTADGGSQSDPDQNKMIPIIAAGGEYVIHPRDVRNIGGGDLTKGHNELDKFVLKTRRELRQKLGKLAPPKVD